MIGGVFLTFSILMLFVPRFTNILEVFPFWCIYIISALILTFVASLKFDSSPLIKPEYEDDILDDIEEEEHA